MNYYLVAPAKSFHKDENLLTYESEVKLAPGQIVAIPFGKQTTIGIIAKKTEQPDFATKPIAEVLYDTPLPKHLLKALFWLTDYYRCPLSSVVQAALPRGITKKRRSTSNSLENTLYSTESQNPLSSAQKRAISELEANPANTVLLHGITGSGTRARSKDKRSAHRPGTRSAPCFPSSLRNKLPNQRLTCFQYARHDSCDIRSYKRSDSHRKHTDRQEGLKPQHQIGNADQEQQHTDHPKQNRRDIRGDQACPFQQEQHKPHWGEQYLEYHTHVAPLLRNRSVHSERFPRPGCGCCSCVGPSRADSGALIPQ
jgi:primosomal protein N'